MKIADKTTTLTVGATQLTVGATQFTVSGTTLTVAATQLTIGATKLTIAATKLTIGATKLTIAATKLTIGATKLTIGATKLTVGATKLTVAGAKLTIKTARKGEKIAKERIKIGERGRKTMETGVGLGAIAAGRSNRGVWVILTPSDDCRPHGLILYMMNGMAAAHDPSARPRRFNRSIRLERSKLPHGDVILPIPVRAIGRDFPAGAGSAFPAPVFFSECGPVMILWRRN